MNFDNLKQAATLFYEGSPTTGMTDKEFDEQRKLFLEVNGYDILRDLEFEGFQKIEHPEDLIPLPKIQVEEDLAGEVLNHNADSNHYIITPKYDGSSIVIYYKNGIIDRILTKSSDEYGIDQTQKLINFVPHSVNPLITSIQCEALVSLDEGLGGRTRNKANGLINSKYMSEEVDDLLTLRAFRINYSDGGYDYDRFITDLYDLPEIKNKEGRLLFRRSYVFQDIADIPQNDMMKVEDEHFLVDGVVVYSDKGMMGFKFYYTESADAVIKNIDWGLNSNEGYAPVAIFDTVEIQGANISRASFNGINKLLELEAGIGSTVKVIKANSTIPKIIDVYNTSEDYNYPKCERWEWDEELQDEKLVGGCGIQLTPEDSQYGNVLKCHNPDCHTKVDYRYEMLVNDPDLVNIETEKDFEEKFNEFFFWFTGDLLNIDRFKPASKINSTIDVEDLKPKVVKNLLEGDYESYYKNLYYLYDLTELQDSLYELNIKATFNAIVKFIKLKIK